MDDQLERPSQVEDMAAGLMRHWDHVHDEAVFELGQLGFAQLPKPNFTCPAIDPKALSQMNMVQYAETHLRYQAWVAYTDNLLAHCKSMLIGVKRQMEELDNYLKLEYGKAINTKTGKPYGVEDRKMLASSNPRHLELLRDKTKLESQKELLESYLSGFSGTAAIISRHIELRKLDIDSQRMNNNMPGRGMYQQP